MSLFRTIQTSRLLLRQFQESDLLPFMCYRNDPEIARYQSWDAISETAARAFVQAQKTQPAGVPGQWLQVALEHKATGTMIGDCALKLDAEDARLAEIGFTLDRAFQAQGYATEAVSGLLDYVFGELRAHRVHAVTDARNAGSVGLLERLGFRREGHFIQNVFFKGAWGDEYLYALLAAEWRTPGRVRSNQ